MPRPPVRCDRCHEIQESEKFLIPVYRRKGDKKIFVGSSPYPHQKRNTFGDNILPAYVVCQDCADILQGRKETI